MFKQIIQEFLKTFSLKHNDFYSADIPKIKIKKDINYIDNLRIGSKLPYEN